MHIPHELPEEFPDETAPIERLTLNISLQTCLKPVAYTSRCNFPSPSTNPLSLTALFHAIFAAWAFPP
jgi:hypothetical protein